MMKKKQRIIWLLLMVLSVNVADLFADGGNPFFKNYIPSVYHAHNRNFDIVADDYGRVFVANFEGLLYYDQSSWHVIHAPGIYRFTTLYKDHNGRIWFGGYNLFGYLSAAANGELVLNYLFSEKDKGFLGNVNSITEEEGRICLETPIGREQLAENNLTDYVIRKATDKKLELVDGFGINQQLTLPDKSKLLATAGAGLLKLDANGKVVFSLSEQNGLCDNNVNAIYADSLGYVWGATDKGIFLVDINPAFTHFGPSEGLQGEVQSICNTVDGIYVATLRGLFRQVGNKFTRIEPINHACWQLVPKSDGEVLVGTARGLYAVRGAQVRQLTAYHTVSLYTSQKGDVYTGEIDGVYYLHNGVRKPLNSIEKATGFIMEGDSVLWVRNIYGQIFRCGGDKKHPEMLEVVEKGDTEEETQKEVLNNQMFLQNGRIYVVSHLGLYVWNSEQMSLRRVNENERFTKKMHEYPQFVYPDRKNLFWTTNRVGKNLTAYTKDMDITELNESVCPVSSFVIRCMDTKNHEAWFGGEFGLVHWDSNFRSPDFKKTSDLYIRRIELNNEQVIWGGFDLQNRLDAHMPMKKMTFDDGLQNVRIEFSTQSLSTLGDIQYRYRYNKTEDWSDWSTENSATLVNPRPGKYHFEVMARNRYGRISAPATFDVTINNPIYLRWYSWVGYVLLLSLFIFLIIKWRMKRLLLEKQRLEAIVESRTSQIRQQKDEIEEKSKNLETALDDLSKAQFELIRQEKMATVGTLTQGLVDRILNPMNYVNNFSHMSLGLIQDMQQNIDDDKEKITPDIYEDSIDILDMLTTNLQKIEEHGLNTTRILKAMEEMLKERTGKMTPTDIVAIGRKNFEMLGSYFSKDIAEIHIQLQAPTNEQPVVVVLDAEQFSKTIMSILSNSMYALKKKAVKVSYEPVVRMEVTTEGDKANIKIFDNGIGIEKSIMDKLFDPFFTTKTTAEAVGVGLYISREVVRNHGGDIVIQSEKDEFTEIIITLPLSQKAIS